MELNLSELDNTNTMNPYESFDYNSYQQNSGENYWEKPKEEESEFKKKKVSFNDILSNMNLVVNKQGVLQFMVPNKELQRQNYNYNSNEFGLNMFSNLLSIAVEKNDTEMCNFCKEIIAVYHKFGYK